MSNYIVVYFNHDNTFTIIDDSKNKFKNSSKAKVIFNNVWYNGEIVCSGSKKKCKNYAEFKLSKSTFVASDDSDVDTDDESDIKRLAKNNESAFQQEIDKINILKRKNGDKSYDQSKKRTFISPNNIDLNDCHVTREDDLISVENVSNRLEDTYENENLKNLTLNANNESNSAILEDLKADKDLRQLYLEQSKKMDQMMSIIESLNSNLTKKHDKHHETEEELIYNGTNLLAIPEHLPNKYVNACMRILFTHEELVNGYIIYGKKQSKTKRKELDKERIEILKSKNF